MTYSRWNNLLHFADLLEDDRSKISLTKVQAWGGALVNFFNLLYQFLQTHPDAVALGVTTITHAIVAAKHEFKRRFN